jgi:hypothetical protein
MKVDLGLTTLNNRIQQACQLQNLTVNNGKSETPWYPEKENERLITREENGRYNFDILKEKQDKDKKE